ncbi:MAG: RDD family protein [Deltaproteobacteria bacterium]|nr:RDD family protein [Deltaproteobacteria bacterium]
MAPLWEDDEEQTEIDYRRSSRVLIHDEITTPLEEEMTYQEKLPPKPVPPQESSPLPPLIEKQSPWSYEKAPRALRFLAFLLDMGFLYLLNRFVGLYLVKFLDLKNLKGLYESSQHLLIYLGVIFLLSGLYYFILEGIWGLSLGKLICGLRIRCLDGSHLGFKGALKRTLLKPIDYLPPFFLSLLSMDQSVQDQSLGDRFAGTQVLQKPQASKVKIPSSQLKKAPLWRRLLAGALDLSLSLGLGFSLLAMMDWTKPILSNLLYVSAPLAFLSYFALVEGLGFSTPGKWIFSLRVLSEEGENIHLSQALLRTLFIPLDLILGYGLSAVTPRRQRLGDLVARTQVYFVPKIKAKKALAILSLALLILSIFGASQNQHSLIKRYFKIDSYWELNQLWLVELLKEKDKKISKQASSPKQTLPLGSYELGEYFLSTSSDPLKPQSNGNFYSGEWLFFVWESLSHPVKPISFEILDQNNKKIDLGEINFSPTQDLGNDRFRQALSFRLDFTTESGNYYWKAKFPDQKGKEDKNLSGTLKIIGSKE